MLDFTTDEEKQVLIKKNCLNWKENSEIRRGFAASSRSGLNKFDAGLFCRILAIKSYGYQEL